MFADQPADRMRREWVAQQHKNKVTRVRGTVSTGWSHGQVHQFGSLGRNGKKAMNDIVRQKEIDRENERLVGRFLDMEARRPRGSVAAPARVKQRVGPTSLNVSNRKREEDRIWKENQRMMKRIQKSKPYVFFLHSNFIFRTVTVSVNYKSNAKTFRKFKTCCHFHFVVSM